MTGVAILGCTGSIGRQTLDVIRQFKDKFRVTALVCGSDAETLLKQAEEFKPDFVGIADKTQAEKLKSLSYKCDVFLGPDAQQIAASLPDTDLVVAAVVGLNGLTGVVAALNAGKKVALANKETLVACGSYVTRLAKEKGVELFPVDSEHSAVYQCLKCGRAQDLKRIILTASGGPFFGAQSLDELKDVTPEQAVKHPNWSMGKKISVDSATMMNKGLEIIEARWLFGTTDIDYVIQRGSIIHSMVEFKDGSVIAQIAPPDMKLPISYALGFPERLPSQSGNFDFSKPITFEKPNETVFPLPKYARQAMMAGGTAPAALNAANEAAVKLFLDGKIAFTDILRLVEHILNSEKTSSYSDYREIISLHSRVCDRIIRDYAHILRY